ncbi:hypothetical protein DEA8626_02591 [Defluviimonas aquaemixtae]|uniref:Smr domain-containing protein n=1 Tax=Albidovulum aquaemixtae TaxID=1542388 RepID=A0A2R8BJK1_9RHOB|nr:Smr/MutS family protein [Defluviimonas aquaemixtae]SPH23527.1 hypothetical protein DEA8626_02591 [Defluviimonas aquaemixtae]
MTRRPRGLSPEEQELWGRVAATARPIRPVAPTASSDGAPAKQIRSGLPHPDFRASTTVRPLTAIRDALPQLNQSAAMPLRMDRRLHTALIRGKLRPEARLDLHGMTLAEAHPELIRFVLSAQAHGKRLVLVITGKGRRGADPGPIPERIGILRHQVPHWLAQPPLGGVALQVLPAHQKHGGAGAFYVYLRRAR